MFELKEKMIEDIQLHGLKESTQKVYCDAIQNLSKFHGKPPEQLEGKDIRQFFLNLVNERKVSRVAKYLQNSLVCHQVFFREKS